MGEFFGVAEHVDADEEEEAFIGHDELLLFFGQHGVGEVHAVDVLGEGSFADELFYAIVGGRHHIGIEVVYSLASHVDVDVLLVVGVLASSDVDFWASAEVILLSVGGVVVSGRKGALAEETGGLALVGVLAGD